MLAKGFLKEALIFKKCVETSLGGESLWVCVCLYDSKSDRRELSDFGMALIRVGKRSMDLIEQKDFHGEHCC